MEGMKTVTNTQTQVAPTYLVSTDAGTYKILQLGMTQGESSEEHLFSNWLTHLQSLFYQEFCSEFFSEGVFGGFVLLVWGGWLVCLRTLIGHRIRHTLNSIMPLSSPHVAAGLASFVFFSDSQVMVLLLQLYYSHSCAYLLTAKQQVQMCYNL